MKKFSTFLEAEGSWRKEGPWRKVKPGPRKDKYGNTVKDKNVARNLARSAMKKTAAGKTDEATMADEGYIGAKGEKGRDYHNAGTFDKATAYGHAKKHNGVVHKDPSGKYLVKHGKGKHVGEENVQEISKGKLKRYVAKATSDAGKASGDMTKGDPDAALRLHKRISGVNTAQAKLDKMRKEATYQGKKVPLNKPMAGDVKKSKVYVDPDGDGVAKKVNFGDKNMKIKKNIPARRKSFRARHNCDNPGPKDKARYWSCKAW